MKYLIIIIIGVVGWIGFETHKRNEVEVQQTISEQLINNGYNRNKKISNFYFIKYFQIFI